MKKFRLTPTHLFILREMNKKPAYEWTLFRLLEASGWDLKGIWSLRGFLVSLRKEGYLVSRQPRKLTYWMLGPLSDKLKDEGILD